MLGEQIGMDKGRVTNRRVLDGEIGPSVETSFESQGKLLGIESNGFGTYTSKLRPDGSLFAQGQGVIMSAKGEKATWKGQGVGHFTDKGVIEFRGALFYTSEGSNWSKLSGTAAVFEHNVAVDGTSESKVWQWK